MPRVWRGAVGGEGAGGLQAGGDHVLWVGQLRRIEDTQCLLGDHVLLSVDSGEHSAGVGVRGGGKGRESNLFVYEVIG